MRFGGGEINKRGRAKKKSNRRNVQEGERRRMKKKKEEGRTRKEMKKYKRECEVQSAATLARTVLPAK